MGVNADTLACQKETPGNANDFPEPWDEVPVEEFLGDDSEGDDEDDIDEEDEEW